MYLYKNILWALSSAMILELLLENKYNSSYHRVTFWCVGRSKPIEIIFSLCAYDWVHTYFVYIDILLNTRICTQAHKENEVCVTTWTNSWYYLSGSLEVKNEKAAACCLPSGGAWVTRAHPTLARVPPCSQERRAAGKGTVCQGRCAQLLWVLIQ